MPTRAFFLFSLALISLFHPGLAAAGNQDNAKVALHVTPRVAKSAWICLSDQSGGGAPSGLPCDDYATEGDLGVWYDVYLVVGKGNDADPPPGIGGLSCGISYDPEFYQGVDIASWTRCADGLEFLGEGPYGTWPQPESGMRVTWLDCASQPILGPGGQHARRR